MQNLPITYDNDPYEQWYNLKTKEPILKGDHDSLFEFCKKTSNYHFDESVDDRYSNPPVIIPLCRFKGDWIDEVRKLSKQATPASFDFRAETRADNNNDMEFNDFKRWGYDVGEDGKGSYHVLSRIRHTRLPDKLQKMADTLGVVGPNNPDNLANIKFDTQRPGQSFYWHIDNFGGIFKRMRRDYTRTADIDHDQRKVMRLIIFLDDQKIGQVWRQGNCYIEWKKGDCFTWPWRDIPHGTANFSHYDRPVINITGRVTEQTYEFLKSGNREVEV